MKQQQVAARHPVLPRSPTSVARDLGVLDAWFEEAYKGIADRLKLPGRNNPKTDTLQLVRDWLCDEANGRWTMVLDNADDAGLFFPRHSRGPRSRFERSGSTSRLLAAYLPNSHGSILITSQSKDTAARLTGSHKNIKEVHAMDKRQALQLLRNKLKDATKAAW